MKRAASDHPKLLDLAEALNRPRYQAVGILELLWHFTAKHATGGDVGKFSDVAIARAIGWEEAPEDLERALLKTGWLDPSEEHRLLVHDWPAHADDAVHRALARACETFADGTIPKLTRVSTVERCRAEAHYKALAKRAPQRRKTGVRTTGARNAPCPAPPRLSPAPPEPRPAEEESEAPRAPATDEIPLGERAKRWANVIANQPGDKANKFAFLESHLEIIEAEAIAALPQDRRDHEAIRAKTRSLIIRYWKQELKGPRTRAPKERRIDRDVNAPWRGS